MQTRFTLRLFTIALALALAGCSGDDGGSTPTSPGQGGGGGTGGGGTGSGTAAATITITSDGVSPKTVTVPVGSRVMFVNNDSRPHDMASDPHPVHTNCPPLNEAGFLSPGQSRQTGVLGTAMSCGFHDHSQPTVSSLQGTIVIQ